MDKFIKTMIISFAILTIAIASFTFGRMSGVTHAMTDSRVSAMTDGENICVQIDIDDHSYFHTCYR